MSRSDGSRRCMSLRAALAQPWWFAVTLAGYVTAFWLMAVLQRQGSAIGVIFGIWVASGAALTGVAGAVSYGDAPSLVGIAVVIAGVVLVETGHSSNERAKQVPA